MQFRNLYSDALRLCMLPPRGMCAACRQKCIFNLEDYDTRLAKIRRLRGDIFVADGAIAKEHLDESGGYSISFDDQAWHVYLTGNEDEVCACCTLMLHRKGVGIEDLRMHELIRRIESDRRGAYEAAIQLLIQQAHDRKMGFGEAAAWAVREDLRNRRASMMIVVAAWPLYQMLGEALVIGAPTLRHQTSSIEKRLGGFPLSFQDSPLGTFHDPAHQCDMEFVWFDSERPLPKYAQIISEMRAHFEKLNNCRCKSGALNADTLADYNSTT